MQNLTLRHTLAPLFAVLAIGVSAPAAASEAIVKKARCVACHAGAPARLFEKVRNGGSGVWGQVPMMAHPADKISDDDLKAAIHWILALD